MSVVQIYDSPFITLEYHPDKDYIYHTIHYPMGEDQTHVYKEALEAGTEALQRYQLSKWLSDDRKNGPFPKTLFGWGCQDWIPRTVAIGWQYWAIIVPKEVHAAGSLIPVIEAFQDAGVRVKLFTTLVSAQTWLELRK